MKTFLYLRADGLLTLDGQWQCWCWSLGQPVRMASLVAQTDQQISATLQWPGDER